MYENLKMYKCGGCGNTHYTIYKDSEDSDTPGRIITVCTNCKSETEIVIVPAKLGLEWGKHGDGIMTIY